MYVSTPLQTCESRGVKGLYAKAQRSEIHPFTGFDDPYEVPLAPEIDIDTSRVTVDQAVSRIIAYMADLGLLGNLRQRPDRMVQQPALDGPERRIAGCVY